MDPGLQQLEYRNSSRRKDIHHAILALLILLTALPVYAQSANSPDKSPGSDWIVTWSDEFNGPDGSLPDPNKWTVESGGYGWGNDELECYTPRAQNARIEKGSLVIEADKENLTCADGARRAYTSARLKTQGHFSQKYGRFEARIRVPSGKGMWPAFWMLGDDFSTAGWPACGEIDIMENAGGSEPAIIHGSLHGPGYIEAKSLTATYTLPKGAFSDDFHVFAIEWAPRVVRFFVDGQLYSTRTPANVPAGKRWVYDQPFFILVNLAVGGSMPGNPDDSTVFPQRMLVDYVRVYRRK